MKANQTRQTHLEALETRQMLSAVSFTADNLVESNQFQAILGNEKDAADASEKYIVLNIASANQSEFRLEDLTITDSSDKKVEVLASKMENGVASILAKYTLGESYVFEVASANDDAQFNVLFTAAGDLDADGSFTREEYYTLFGEVMKGQGTNNQFISVFKNIYGVDISANSHDAIYDLDGSGKISRNTFDTVIAPNYSENFVLTQKVSVAPDLEDFQINGKSPNQVPNDKFSFVTNESKNLVLSGKTDAADCVFTYTDKDGAIYSGQIDLTKAGTYTLETKKDDSAAAKTIQLTYAILEDGSFTLTFPEAEYGGSFSMEIWGDAEHSLDSSKYTVTIDTAEPEIFIVEAQIKDAKPDEKGQYLINTKEFTLNVSMDAAEAAVLENLKTAAKDPLQGFYVRVFDKNGKELTQFQLSESSITAGEDGKILIADTNFKMSLEDGTHELTAAVTDLAGNIYANTTVLLTVSIDATAPELKIDGYETNVYYDSKTDKIDQNQASSKNNAMLVTKADYSLTVSANETGTTVTCKQNGTEVKPTEKDASVYAFTLKAGLNTIVFTAVDEAGNVTTETCLVYYSDELALTQAGKTLQEKGLTFKYEGESSKKQTLDLYQYFTYDEGLTFTASSSDLSEISVSADKKGVLTFNCLKLPTEKDSVDSKITILASNSAGKVSILQFEVTFVYAVKETLWTDVSVKDDFKENSLAKLGENEHIVSADSITLTGTLNSLKNSQNPVLTVKNGSSEIISSIDLTKGASGDSWTYDIDSKGKFTLTLKDLKDGLYVFTVSDKADSSLTQTVKVYADSTAPAAVPQMTANSLTSSAKPKFTFTVSGTLDSQDDSLGAWVQIYAVSSAANAQPVLYAQAKYDSASDKFSALEYLLEKGLEEGTYTFKIQTIDAAGNVTKGNELTVTVDTDAPAITVEGYEENYRLSEESEKFDAMLVENDAKLQLAVTVRDDNLKTFTCKLNGTAVTPTSEENGMYIFDLQLQSELNSAVFTAIDANGSETVQICQIYCTAPVTVTAEGEKLQKEGLTLEFDADSAQTKIDLSKLFNYGLTVSMDVTSSNSANANIKEITEDGLLVLEFPTEPKTGEILTSEITIKAENTLGSSAELKFLVRYCRNSEFFKEIVVENDSADDSLADVEHITAQNSIKITGKLDLPTGSGQVQMNVTRGSEVLYSDIDVTKSSTVGENFSYTVDSETGNFTLILTNLQDGAYQFSLTIPNSGVLPQTFTVIADASAPGVSAAIKSPEFTNTNPVVSLELSGTLDAHDASCGAWVEILIADAAQNEAVYARTKFDAETGTIGELEYLLTERLNQGIYYLTVRVIDAAGNVTEGQETLAVTIDRTNPIVSAEDYVLNHQYSESSSGFDSMLVTKDTLSWTVKVSEANLDSLTLTLNGTEIAPVSTAEDGTFTYEITLSEGLNTLVSTALDKAGNSHALTSLVVWENAIELTEAGQKLSANGLTLPLILNSETGKLETDGGAIDLKLLTTDSDPEEYTISCTAGITPVTSDEDILTFDVSGLDPNTQSLTADVKIVLTSANGTQCELNFKLTLVNDKLAPQWTNVTLENNFSESSLSGKDFVLSSGPITFQGTLFDASEIRSASLIVMRDGTQISESIDLTQASSSDSYTYEYDAETGLFTFTWNDTQDGDYLFCVSGEDVNGNSSSLEDESCQEFEVHLNQAAPSVTAVPSLNQTGTSTSAVSTNPEFSIQKSGTISNLDAENGVWVQIFLKNKDTGNSILYAQSKFDEELDAFKPLNYHFIQTLTEGVYEFTIQTVNAAGNVSGQEVLNIQIDKTAPKLNLHGYVQDYDSSFYGTFTNGSASSQNCDSMILTDEYASKDSESGKYLYDLGIEAEDLLEVSRAVTVEYESGEKVTLENVSEIPLLYGKNIVTISAVDAAGNASSTEVLIYFNETPKVTALGERLEEKGFQQLAGEASTWKTLNLHQYFTDDRDLKFSISGTPSSEEIEASVDANGILSFRYLKEPTEENSIFSANFTLSVLDEFGESCQISFTASYLLDLVPPQLQNLVLEGKSAVLEEGIVTSESMIQLSGDVYDLSGPESAQMKLTFNEGSESETLLLQSLNLLESSSGTLENGARYDYVFTANEEGTGGTFVLKIWQEDGSGTPDSPALVPIAEGLYSLQISGTDKAGNDSVSDAEGANPKQTVKIYADRTAPGISASMQLVPTGTALNKVNANPTFTLTFSEGTPEPLGTWVEIFLVDTSGETPKETLYASGKLETDGTCTLTYAEAVLPEGTYTFRIQTTDAVGNANPTEGTLSVEIDKTRPVITLLQFLGTKSEQIPTIFTEPQIKVNADSNELGAQLYYSTESYENGILYDSTAGIVLKYGSNPLYFWLQDSAGNRSSVAESMSAALVYDTPPALTEGAAALGDQIIELAKPEETQTEISFQILLSKEQILGMVSDGDADSGDALKCAFTYAPPAEIGSLISMSVTESTSEGKDVFALTFKTAAGNYAALRSLNTFGTVSVLIEDSYGLKPVDEEGFLTFSLLKNTEPVECIGTSVTIPQNDTGTYVFDMNSIFADPQGNAWVLTENFSLQIDGTAVSGSVTLSEDRQSILWTPADDFTGRYGKLTILASAANVDEDEKIKEGTQTDQQTISALVEWTGLNVSADETSISSTEGEGAFAEACQNFFSISNEFDSALAWGGYGNEISVTEKTFTVSVKEENVHGWVLNEDGSRKEKYTSLFTAAPYIEEGEMLEFELNPNAYGTAVLVLKMSWTENGKEKSAECEIPLTVENVPDAPYLTPKSGSFNLDSDAGISMNLLDGCTAGADDGKLVCTGVSFSNPEGFKIEQSSDGNEFLYLTNQATGRKYCFSILLVASTSGEEVTLTLKKNSVWDASGKELAESCWSDLDGVQILGSYDLANEETSQSGKAAISIDFVSEQADELKIDDVSLASGTSTLNVPEAGTILLEVDSASSETVNPVFQIRVKDEAGTLLDTISVWVNLPTAALTTLTISGTGVTSNADGKSWTAAIDANSISTLTLTVTSGEMSASQNLSVKTAAVLMVEDASLKVGTVSQNMQKGYINFSVTSSETITGTEGDAVAEPASGSFLKPGTVLKEGSELSLQIVYGSSLISVILPFISASSGTPILNSDFEIPEEIAGAAFDGITLDDSCDIVVSTLAAGSTLSSGSYLYVSIPCTSVSLDEVEKIYEEYSESGKLLTYEIPASNLGNDLEIVGISVPELPEEHAISQIAWNAESESIVVTYKPYQVTQIRTPIEISVNLANGEKFGQFISMDCETPFTLKYTLTEKMQDYAPETLPESLQEVTDLTKTYYLNVWLQCNLPTYSEELTHFYDVYGITTASGVLSLNSDAVNSVKILGQNLEAEHPSFTHPGIINYFAEEVNGKILLTTSMLAGQFGIDFALTGIFAADGNWLSIGEYEISFTGNADLEIEIQPNLQAGFPFSSDETTETFVGVGAQDVNSAQITGLSKVTFAVAPIMADAAGISTEAVGESLCEIEELAAQVELAGVVSQADLLEDSAALPALADTGFEVNAKLETAATDALPEELPVLEKLNLASESGLSASGISVESFFQGASDTFGCTTETASGIQTEAEILRSLAAAPAIQSAANVLTDQAIERVMADSVTEKDAEEQE